MITKNEFYGAYLIDVTNQLTDKSAADIVAEIELAWDVIDQLQKPRDTSVEFTFQDDDDAEEPKMGTWPPKLPQDVEELFSVIDPMTGRPYQFLSDDGRLVGDTDTIKEYNKDPKGWKPKENKCNYRN